jgi:hypothetical protein
MSVTALHLYEQLTEATDERTKAKIIAEAFAQMEEHYPNLKDVATQGQVRETELRLQKEIKEVEARLTVEMKQLEVRLARDIEQNRRAIREVEVRLTQAIHRQTLWIIGSVGAVVGCIRLLEWFLAHLPQP